MAMAVAFTVTVLVKNSNNDLLEMTFVIVVS